MPNKKLRADPALTRAVQERLRQAMHDDFGKLPGGTQERCAEAIGVTSEQLSKWLNRGLPSVTQLKRISARTGWSIDWLLFGEGPRRRGGAPADKSLAEQLRAYLVKSPVFGRLDAIELLEDTFIAGLSDEDPDSGDAVEEVSGPSGRPIFRYRTRGSLADHLPKTSEELLMRTASLWYDSGRRSADREQAEEALEAAIGGARLPENRRDDFLRAYAAAQESVNDYSAARTTLWLTIPPRKRLAGSKKWKVGSKRETRRRGGPR